jgi:hypothetical protein
MMPMRQIHHRVHPSLWPPIPFFATTAAVVSAATAAMATTLLFVAAVVASDPVRHGPRRPHRRGYHRCSCRRRRHLHIGILIFDL